MAELVYASNMSLDGCTEAADGAFDWAPPADDVFVDVTSLMAAMGTYVYGRRMYETMAVWETDPALGAQSDQAAAFAAAWQAADKVVCSTTLAAPATARTRLERSFDPAMVRDLVAAAPRDVLIGGPHLAGEALRAGLVDRIVLWVWPITLGGRNPALPPNVRRDLTLADVHRFDSGVVRLTYRST